MQVGAQRIIGEVLFPQTRRQLCDPGGGVLRDPLEDVVDEIGIGIDAVQSAGHDQALNDTDVSGAEFGPAE